MGLLMTTVIIKHLMGLVVRACTEFKYVYIVVRENVYGKGRHTEKRLLIAIALFPPEIYSKLWFQQRNIISSNSKGAVG